MPDLLDVNFFLIFWLPMIFITYDFFVFWLTAPFIDGNASCYRRIGGCLDALCSAIYCGRLNWTKWQWNEYYFSWDAYEANFFLFLISYARWLNFRGLFRRFLTIRILHKARLGHSKGLSRIWAVEYGHVYLAVIKFCHRIQSACNYNSKTFYLLLHPPHHLTCPPNYRNIQKYTIDCTQWL